MKFTVPLLAAMLAAWSVGGAEAPAAAPLQRVVTRPFPADFAPYQVRRSLSLNDPVHPAVIIADRADRDLALGKRLQARLRQICGVELPLEPHTFRRTAGRTLVLYGDNLANFAVRRLAETGRLESPTAGSELRIMPDLPDCAGAVYCGGNSPEQVLAALDELPRRFPDPTKIGAAAVLERHRDHRCDPATNAAIVEAMRETYRNPPNLNPNSSVIGWYFKPLSDRYRQTGCDCYARTFAECQKVFAEHYESSLNDRRSPPNFFFYQFPWFVDNIADSPAYTDADRRQAAELIRLVTEHILEDKDMTLPLRNFASPGVPYYTNHPIFSARSVYFAAEYLLRHYRFAPAEYWRAVAEKALAGIVAHPLGPEDATDYQAICYRNVLNYLIAAGKADETLFDTPQFRAYIRYLVANYNHLGYTAGYGDSQPLFNARTVVMLLYAADLLGDPEAAYLAWLIKRTSTNEFYRVELDRYALDREVSPPAVGKGMHLFPMDDFRLDYNHSLGFYTRPVLDKAIFRTSWRGDSDFLVLSGVSAAPHGHIDANAVSMYVHGPHVWLIEGDYIRKFPDENNSVTIRANGVSRYPNINTVRQKSRFSQILGSVETADRGNGALSLLVEDCNDTDWTREIGWESRDGFWCVDRFTARRDGDYQFDLRWRLLGDYAGANGQSVVLRQRPGGVPGVPETFTVSEGSGALRLLSSQYDTSCFLGKNGSYRNYPLAGPDLRVVLLRRGGPLKAGESVEFVSLLQPGDRPTELRTLAPGVHLARTGDQFRLTAGGAFRRPGIDLDARRIFIGPTGVTLLGARRFHFGDRKLDFAEPTDLALPAEPADQTLLAGLAGDGAAIPAAAPQPAAAPELAALRLTLPAAVRALAAAPNGNVAAGMEDGGFRIFDRTGKLVAERKFPQPVVSVAAIALADGSYGWALGTLALETIDGGSGPLHLLGPDGTERWNIKLPAFHGRNGTARGFFAARLDGADRPPTLMVVGEGVFYYAIRPDDGGIRWKYPIVHSNTAGAAADLDGDGRDEIIPGNEYYWHRVIDDDGKQLMSRTARSAPWVYCAAAPDMDGDGRPEAAIGVSDGSILFLPIPGGGPTLKQPVNVGGRPVGMAALDAPDGVRLAVATLGGELRYLNGRGETVRTVRFDAPLLRLAVRGDRLLVTSQDGMLYRLDLRGNLTGRASAGAAPSASGVPEIATGGPTTAFAAGRNLLLIQEESR